MVADTGIFIEHLRAKDKLSTTLYKIADGTDSKYQLYLPNKEELRTVIGNVG